MLRVHPSSFALALVLVLATATGCSFDESAQGARGCGANCAPGMCYLDYCLQTADEVDGVDGAGSGGGGATDGGAAGNSGEPSAGAGGTSGAGGAGGTSGTAGTGAAGGSGGAGGTGGSAPPDCTSSDVERCNGVDDDCDGATDEDTTIECYPDATAGCAPNATGFDCAGLCTTGMQVCENGELSACAGHVGPVQELCGGAEAADENCDGQVDDDCPCSGDETQVCYDGPDSTVNVGRCRAGMQRCENGLFGECEGSIEPRAESCANQGSDDNCNRIVDDVFGVGFRCTVDANQGVCRTGRRACRNGALTCITPAPVPETRCDGLDEDCDGRFDETFLTQTDPSNCGACGMRCASNEACCGGACVATDTIAHCGGCGGCSGGQACCGGECVTIGTAEHCTGCGACERGLICCSGECVEPRKQGNPCGGGCNFSCGDGCTCIDGECVDHGGRLCQ